MTERIKAAQDIMEVVPDILLWIDDRGHLIDFHPNNHAFLFDREGGSIGLSLEEIFNKEVCDQMLQMGRDCRNQKRLRTGQIIFRTEKSVSKFDCRITPVNEDSFVASWRESTNQISESRKSELIRGNGKVTHVLLTESSLEDAVSKSFRILGKTYGADRIMLFRNQTDPVSGDLIMQLQFEWSHTDVHHRMESLQLSSIPYNPDFSLFYESLENNTHIIALTEDLPPEIKMVLNRINLQSVIIMPVCVRNNFWGFLGFGDCKTPRIWKEDEVTAIKAISLVFGAVIQKHQDQEDLTIARLQAEESDRLKSSILANINHELRTPMTGILGFSEILSEQLADEDTRQMAENIQVSGRRLLSTLNSMIELSQFEAKKALFKLMETKLNELILLTCEPHLEKAKEKMLGFDIYMYESIFSYIDEKLFIQLLNHILENAVKFTQTGKIAVETTNRWDEGKPWSCISIIDTGPGIPKGFHEVIFEEFRQVSEGYNRSFEGSGLGLTLSKKIVELMNGKLTVASKEGLGSTFTIWLPSSQPGISEVRPFTQERDFIPDLAFSPGSKPVHDLPSVLVVEDNQLNSELILIYLRSQCSCEMAQNGEAAVRMAMNKQYEIILMDINLGSGIDGMEATRQILKIPGYKDTPIVAVTGYTMDSDREKILAAGCTHYLTKPIDKCELSSLIACLVAKS